MRSTHDETDLTLRVAARELVSDGVISLELEDPEGRPLPEWTPGSHVDLRISDAMVRQYSLSGDPADRHSWRLGVLRERESRGGSHFLHDRLAAGDTIAVRGPRNNFALEPAEHYIFIAGGIGITPILPMVAAAQAAGSNWQLVYGGRTRNSMAYTAELEPYGERVRLWPEDEHGLIDLPGVLGEPRENTLVYCCGPGPLLDAVERQCAIWPSGALHVERFTPKQIATPEVEASFEVELASSGLTLTVPADRTILDIVTEAGVDAPSSCGEGTCGTCEVVVLEGEVDHRDSLMSAEEQAASETMMICVSRARGRRLVLDM